MVDAGVAVEFLFQNIASSSSGGILLRKAPLLAIVCWLLEHGDCLLVVVSPSSSARTKVLVNRFSA